MITCPSCEKQNQDYYKFCLGCGTKLPRGEETDLDETAPQGLPQAEDDEATQQIAVESQRKTPVPVAASVASESEPESGDDTPPKLCPSCSHPNPTGNRFCAACGFKLEQQPNTKTQPPPARLPHEDDSGVVLTALSPDGAEAGSYAMPKGDAVVGRDTGSIFGNDDFLSPEHAQFSPEDGKLFVEDAGSLNGIFRKLLADQKCPLSSGQVFRIGQELVRFEAYAAPEVDEDGVEQMGGPVDGYMGRIAMVIGRKSEGTAFPLSDAGICMGRERGEVLFPDDGYVSGLHCRLSCEDGGVYLTDLGSSNGTFVQLHGKSELFNGDILLMGQQLYRVTL